MMPSYRGRVKIYDRAGMLVADKSSKRVFKSKRMAEKDARNVGHYILMDNKYPVGSRAEKFAEPVGKRSSMFSSVF